MHLGNFGSCTDSNPCGEDEGDCDLDSHCKDNHNCGTDNCRSSVGFESYYDCCYSIDEDFCTIENPCKVDQGDCDSNVECLDGLVCGLNNCPDSLGYDFNVDCCYGAINGDDDFCTSDNNPCGVHEGDCDSNNECQTNLVCDTANSCPAYLGFAYDVNCCNVGCKFPRKSSNFASLFTHFEDNFSRYQFVYFGGKFPNLKGQEKSSIAAPLHHK